MRFPDPNVGYVFGYRGTTTGNGIEVTFLSGRVRILFRPRAIRSVWPEIYQGGRISWSVIRFGRCPRGTRALHVQLTRGLFRDHLVVLDDLDGALVRLREAGVRVVGSAGPADPADPERAP